MAEGVFLKLKEEIDGNYELPILGGWSFDTYQSGNGSGVASMYLVLYRATTLTISNGEFFSDADATVSLGQKVEAPIAYNGYEIFYKLYDKKGVITSSDAMAIGSLGGGSNQVVQPVPLGNVNSPYAEISLDYLPVNVATYYNGYGATKGDIKGLLRAKQLTNVSMLNAKGNSFHGTLSGASKDINYLSIANTSKEATFDINVLRATSYYVNGKNLTVIGSLAQTKADMSVLSIVSVKDNQITGSFADLTGRSKLSALILEDCDSLNSADLKDLPASVKRVRVPSMTNIVHTGSRSWNAGFTELNMGNSPIALSTLQKILLEINSSVASDTVTGKSIVLLCSEDINLSQEAETARTSLISKGFTVQLNRQ